MGFLDKMKNLFTEEVEEEEIKPQKKETRAVETPTPRRETVVAREPVMTVTESKVEENKEKFVFPVYFDDKDFDDLEKPKVKEKPKTSVPKEPKKEPYQGAKVTIEPEPKRVFKPSPIISPVYGVLDKNYSKEDITTKKENNRTAARSSRSSHVTIDDIRNKAYGTLEDDLENTLFHELPEIEEDSKYDTSNQEALDIFNELNFDTIEEKKDEAFEKLEENILLDKEEVDDDTEELARQLEEQKKKLEEINQYMNDTETIEEEVSVDDTPNEESNLNDSELFDLIDSMYEKREEE